MSEPRDEIAEILAAQLNIVGPMRHIFGAHATSRELLDVLEVLLAQETETLATALAERDRRVAGSALRRFADRFRPGDGNPWALHVRARARRAAEQIERGE